MNLEVANWDDVGEIVNLVNDAYRGQNGWTKETDIVKGARTNKQVIESVIKNTHSHLLIVRKQHRIVACVCVEKKENDAYISLFAVSPKLQGKGIGKKVLELIEGFASQQLGACKFVMIVVSQRPELIAFYGRRGYIRTGLIEEYPVHLDVGIPKVKGLTIEYLEKYAR